MIHNIIFIVSKATVLSFIISMSFLNLASILTSDITVYIVK